MVSTRSAKSTALRLLPLLFPMGALSTFNCLLVKDGITFHLEELRGEHSIVVSEPVDPNMRNTTWTINLCAPLKVDDKIPQRERCDTGTRICGIQQFIDLGTNPPNATFESAIPITGEYTNRHIDEDVTRLKKSPAHDDEGKEGLRLVLHGGEYNKKAQKANIEMICDPKRTGWEGSGKTGPEKLAAAENTNVGSVVESATDLLTAKAKALAAKVTGKTGNSMRTTKRNHVSTTEDDKKDDKKEDDKDTPSLEFVSYKDDELRLKWRTKYACEQSVDKPDGSTKGSWGFFTWVIIVVFLGIAAYLIFGSWLNYNRYGARGNSSRPSSSALPNGLSSKQYHPLPLVLHDSEKALPSSSGAPSPRVVVDSKKFGVQTYIEAQSSSALSSPCE